MGPIRRASGNGCARPKPGPRGNTARPEIPYSSLTGTEAMGAVLGNVSRKNQVFAAAAQNLAERGFDPRTFGL